METRVIKGCGASEIYVTGMPRPCPNAQTQSEELFKGIARILRANNAYILQERVFGTDQALKTASAVRTKIYDELDDGVAPTWLVTSEGVNGQIAGIQVHAISGCGRPGILKSDNVLCGRIARAGGLAYLTLSGIRCPRVSGRVNQARAMIEKAASILHGAGAHFLTVPRTWMWLKDILAWYGDFNLVRNTYYKECGIIAADGDHKLPASTGIGIRTNDDSLCALELAAVTGDQSVIEYLNAGGNQNSAFDYGSAFSRACKAKTPGGETIYISGTASIGADGETVHIGDARAQIKATVDNVRAVLEEFKCSDNDVIQAIGYCKTPEVEKEFVKGWSELAWPIVPVIADICRDDLLFEIEATAAKSGGSGSA